MCSGCLFYCGQDMLSLSLFISLLLLLVLFVCLLLLTEMSFAVLVTRVFVSTIFKEFVEREKTH